MPDRRRNLLIAGGEIRSSPQLPWTRKIRPPIRRRAPPAVPTGRWRSGPKGPARSNRGTKRGAAGVAFGADEGPASIGGQTLDGIVVTEHEPLAGLR